MNSEAIKKHLAEKLERIPEVIQVTIHRHGDLIAEAIAQVRMAKEREVFQWTGG